MTGARILVVDDTAASRARLIERVLHPAGYTTAEAAGLDEARQRVLAFEPDVVVTGWQTDRNDGLRLLREYGADIPFVVILAQRSLAAVEEALAAGAVDALAKPLEDARFAASIERALRWKRLAHERDTLREQVERQAREFRALSGIGKTITSLLYVDEILAQVVSAAVNLTQADEGSLLLLDPDTGELYLRASKNMDESAARNLRVRVNDSLMGQVIRTGQPVMVGGGEDVKVKTSFLVKSLLGAPMSVGGRVIGVLSVHHKLSSRSFSDHDMRLLSTLADYAAIAIENARLYWAAQGERERLHTILRDTQDAVIVTDPEMRIVLANSSARVAFGLSEDVVGARLPDVIRSPALLDLFAQHKQSGHGWRAEVPLDDGRTMQAQLSEFKGIGFGVVLQDISNLKELDRIKSDFISIVSHDLRTPLTTIRGYVELLPRVGPLNDMQQQFVERIERSMVNIVDLIADLLDVSRIEAGLDKEMEPTDLAKAVREVSASLRSAAEAKRQVLSVDVSPLPKILGNGRRLEQVVANLVGNAIKYTPEGGRIDVSLQEDGEFVVLRVRDTGIGITPEDQSRIFDKFYRVETDATLAIAGTGLGLSIVKSIVEKHKGRVWVDSEPGVGSVFTVVLPKYAAS
ncbi:MAG TPA: ATP-binding protein [Anaerolineae bacterium]|nr:ATP-binding protein [Anaerolineae bacterium]